MTFEGATIRLCATVGCGLDSSHKNERRSLNQQFIHTETNGDIVLPLTAAGVLLVNRQRATAVRRPSR